MSPITRKRMIRPEVATDPVLQPLKKRVVYEALMMLAEDSGCFAWKPREVRHAALPFDAETTDAEVAHMLDELDEDERLWSYEIDGDRFGYIVEFPHWQSSLTRWNAPDRVPLPDGIQYTEIESKNRFGSVRYVWPKSERELRGSVPSQPSIPSIPSIHSPVSSLQTGSEQAAGKSVEESAQSEVKDDFDSFVAKWTERHYSKRMISDAWDKAADAKTSRSGYAAKILQAERPDNIPQPEPCSNPECNKGRVFLPYGSEKDYELCEVCGGSGYA